MPNLFLGELQKSLDARHDEEELLKKEQRDNYAKILDPKSGYSPEMRNWAMDQWEKAHNPGVRKHLVSIRPLLSKIFGGGGDKPAEGEPIPAPTHPVIDETAEHAGEVQRARDLAKYQSELIEDRTKAINAAKPVPQGSRQDLRVTLPNGETVDIQRARASGQYFTLSGDPFELPEGSKIAEKENALRQEYFSYPGDGPEELPHVVYVDPKNPSKRFDASTMQAVPEGAKALDVGTVRSNLRARAYGTGSYNTVFNGLLAQGYPEDQAREIAGEAAVNDMLNQMSLRGATRFREQPVVDPATGTIVAQRLYSGPNARTPIKIPPPNNMAPIPAPGGPLLSAPPVQQPAPAKPAAPRAAAPVAGGRPLVGLTPPQYQNAQQVVKAVTDASIPIFGNPSDPTAPNLSRFADLAKDKAAVERIAAATRVLSMLKDDDLSSAHASASAGGINLGVNQLASLIQNATGIVAADANQRAKVMIDALSSMTQRERDYYNSLLAAKESIVGLRKATAGSSAQFAVEAMANALPVIGQNVVTEEDYRNVLRQQANIFSGSSLGLIRQAMTKEQAEMIDRLKAGGAPAAEPARGAAPVKAPEVKKIRYTATVDGKPKSFDIPENEVAEFLKQFPGAKKK